MQSLPNKSLCLILAFTCFSAQTSQAQQALPATSVPSQIQQAQTILLTNAGADANFPIDETKAFNDIYTALQTWGRYRLVSSPQQADLVFQLRDVAPITGVSGDDSNVHSFTSPAFQLTILDPKSNITLWTITSPVNVVGKSQVLARWVSISETNLVSRVKVLAGQALSPDETAGLTTVPQHHGTRNLLLFAGVSGAAALAGALILHYQHENSITDLKASWGAFCTANHIPLSQCPGS